MGTFSAAGAKMLGYVSSEGYEHSESKSEQDGKFLGLPLDQDNEDDKTEGRVKAWVDRLRAKVCRSKLISASSWKPLSFAHFDDHATCSHFGPFMAIRSDR